ncbi:MAG TPA: tetratricopeptide repeat protein [Solirubrobacteraceae bacterium]|jgi:tetratricopeptide (TPR) repeat protein|nr:tetratricopeptide repeat protein [Solirubrobacteraceae bacterium]
MEDREAATALARDLRWQIEQMGPRGIKNSAGNPYNPSYYKRGLTNAVERGKQVEFVQGYVHKPPSGGYRKLEEADALDLACESLVADADKPYAHLFTDEDREAARARLAPHVEAIATRKAARRTRIETRRADLPAEVSELRVLAGEAVGDEDAIAINLGILERTPDDVVALNRLGRAYEALGLFDSAADTFRKVLEIDGENAIAKRRLRDVERRAG